MAVFTEVTSTPSFVVVWLTSGGPFKSSGKTNKLLHNLQRISCT
nr:MAG TPA: hypothetical protein [Caudoviricetes sp.]